MIKSIASLILTGASVLMLLSGCTKTAESPPKVDAPTAPTAPDKPDAPTAAVAGQNASSTSAASPAGTPAAAEASVSASAIEARAGDVSVKLPE